MASKKNAESPTGTARKTRSRSTSAAKSATSKAASKPATSRKKAARKSARSPSSASAHAAVVAGHFVVEREIGGRKLTLETGRMAKLSDGAVVARYGDTIVLAAVNSSKAPDGIDFFPLTVDYREKTAAAGMIPGGFFKREGRPTTKETLACRIIDRSIRPMFPDGFKRDVQVLSQVLSADRENDPDVLAAVASFAALALSSLPHGRTLGMVRVGLVGDKLEINPLWSTTQSEECKLNLTVAGHGDAVVMVEAAAKEVAEDRMIEALELAHSVIREIVDMVEELAAKAGKPKLAFEAPKTDDKLVAAIDKKCGAALRAAPLTIGPKQVRQAAIKAAKDEAKAAFPAPEGSSESAVKAWDSSISGIIGGIVKQAERDSILKGQRADGRGAADIRQITIEVGLLPCTHGSVLFTRGETQALAVVTLGGTEDQQIIDGLMPEGRKRFILHYAFPPFSVGETKRMLAPGRREIGHGALAERGLDPVLPAKEEFPYTIRITSEILESNGSSSMATVCGGTLAMMDAGVPIKQPVAGIAMGLVMEGKKYSVLSDILGSEDGCGDMDFKVVGTGRGITALQMDIKCEGLTREILGEALEQARQGRLHILREMLKALKQPREQLSPKAPRLVSVKVPPDKIGTIIGPGGKNIRMLQERYECKISIEDSGLCTITGVVGDKVDACVEYVSQMTAEVEMGSVYEGTVSAIKEFGAFVEILPGQEGLVHVSELSNEFISAVTDVVRIGDKIKVKVIAIDDFGKIKLSRKALLDGAAARAPAEGEPAERPARPERGEIRDRDDRGPRRERGDRDRPERRPREGRFGERDEPRRPDRPDRPERVERPERPERMERPERDDRPARPDRPERDDRPARPDRPMRDDRPARADRPERDDRPARPDRPMRDDRPARADRPMRDDRPARPDRPMRDDRPARPDRPMRDDRPARADRPMRDDRPASTDRPERVDSYDRPERGDRRPRRDDRYERDDRGRPSRPDDRPREPRREVEAADRVGFEEPAPRSERDRGGRDRGERDRPARDRFEPSGRSESPRRGDAGRHDRDAEPAPVRDDRGPRRDREIDDRPRGGRDRPVRDERPERPERPARPERDEPVERGGRSRGAAGRGRAPRAMPLAEFDEVDEDAVRPFVEPPHEEVGQLESIDSLLADETDRPAPKRRPRRGPPRR